MPQSFVHLRLHSEYSLVDSVVRLKPLCATVAEQGMPAVALTDQSNLFAMVKFCRAAQSNGIKPIIGADLWLKQPDPQEAPTQIVLLCQNDVGYKNLTEVVSLAYTDGQRGGMAIVDKAWIATRTQGLIALSGGRSGDVGRAILGGNLELAAKLVQEYQSLFPQRFYLELQRTGRDGEELYIAQVLAIASQFQVPVVATNDVRFLKQDDFDAHEVRVCVHDGRALDDPRRPKIYSNEQYLRSPEEMINLFKDIPEAIENTVEIAKRCNVVPHSGEYFLPNFPIPAGETEAEFFARVSREGLDWRLEQLQSIDPEPWSEEKIKSYYDRLDIEVGVILDMGFPGYFLIVMEFIQWSKDNGIPVGPGRGSGAGSIVAYALKITDLDPIEYDLLFERFLNPERISMPDFDVDFCMDGRDRVIDHVAETYGRDQVSQIITYGTMAAKAVVRDVGRVMGHGYGFVDSISKMIPFEVGIKLSQALEQEPEMKERYDNDEEVSNLIDMALKLEGLARNAGKHAGGVVIAPTKLTDFTPLYCEEGGGSLVTQFDKDDVESIGLVKFDFLGLRTLTIIDWALVEVDKRRAKEGLEALDIAKIDLEDRQAFELLKAQQTTAVFQLESSGMKSLIKKLQPDSFEDIIALVALFRPGPLDSGMVDDFINRKHGREPVSYPHQDYQYEGLKPVLEPTYGIILYQEQVMQIAQVMGGYSLGGADMLRRAMGKKKPEEMAKQKGSFLEGCKGQGIDVVLAENIFDLVEKFAGYGFNKSHSAAYALVSYQTAWLKAHYPAEFMSAVLSADMDNTDKVVILIDECRSEHMQLEILPPSVNSSSYKFTVQDEKTIRYGLGALKGVGEGVIEAVQAECLASGEYRDLHDFCRRVEGRKLNRRVLEALVRGGALDEIGPNRASLMAGLDDALKAASQHQKDALAGQVDIFGMVDQGNDFAPVALPELEEWDEEFLLQEEKAVLGLYLTGHPFDKYDSEVIKITHRRLSEHLDNLGSVAPSSQKKWGNQDVDVVVAGLVIEVNYRTFRNGGRKAELVLDDNTRRLNVEVMGECLDAYESLIVKDKVLIVKGGLGVDSFRNEVRVRSTELYDIDTARDHFAKRVDIRLHENQVVNGFMQKLSLALQPYKNGPCPIFIYYENYAAKAPVTLGDEWRVAPRETLVADLRKLVGIDAVKVSY